MRMQGLAFIGVVVLATACWNRRQEVQVASGGEVSAARADIERVGVLPAGVDLSVRTDQAVSTNRTKVGDQFTATVWQPLVARNGEVVIPRGARVYGKITGINDSTATLNRALVQVDFDNLEYVGKLFPLDATITDVSGVIERDVRTGRVVQRRDIPAHSYIGAIIVGPELNGIFQTGLFTVDGGTILSLGQHDVDHVIPQGTPMMLRVNKTVVLR